MRVAGVTVVLAGCCVLAGCGTTYNWTKTHTRQWTGCGVLYYLNIQTEPSEAKIYVDQKYAGVSPVRYTLQLEDVTVRQVGKQPWTHWEDGWGASSDSYGAVSWDADPYPSFGTSAVRIDAFKDGYIDASRTIELSGSNPDIRNAFKGLRPDSGGRFQRTASAGGEVLIRLSPKPEPSRRGLREQEQQQQQQQQTVVIGGGHPSSAAKEMGTVTVRCDLEAAEVYLDGLFVGNTPCTLKLVEGVHVVEVRLDGKQPYKREIRVLADAELTLKAEFK